MRCQFCDTATVGNDEIGSADRKLLNRRVALSSIEISSRGNNSGSCLQRSNLSDQARAFRPTNPEAAPLFHFAGRSHDRRLIEKCFDMADSALNFETSSRYTPTAASQTSAVGAHLMSADRAKQSESIDAMLLPRLIEILNRGQLSALFQPIVNMTTGKIIGYEGLIRGPSDSPHMIMNCCVRR